MFPEKFPPVTCVLLIQIVNTEETVFMTPVMRIFWGARVLFAVYHNGMGSPIQLKTVEQNMRISLFLLAL